MSLGSSPHRNAEDDDSKDEGNEQVEDEASHQEAPKPQVYEGHRNHNTVKGVSFFGPNTEYVVSGSDCGRIFIWKKKGGKLVAMMKGDDQVVNCLEPHPHATVLATSGIDDTVKIWVPLSDRLLDLPQDAERVRLLSPFSWVFEMFVVSHDTVFLSHLLRSLVNFFCKCFSILCNVVVKLLCRS